jgi:hypothetical protein
MGRLGASVAIDGMDAIAGAPGANNQRGAAIAYSIVGVEASEVDVLQYSNVEGDLAGASVAINGDFAVIGVPGRDRQVEIGGQVVLLEDVGAAAVFERQPDSTRWTVRQELQPSDLRPGDAFGTTSAIAGNRLFVGAPEADDAALLSGAVYALDLTEIEDCNENGLDDSLDIIENPSLDQNFNGVLDQCEIGDCVADLNQDGIVNGADMGLLFVSWGPCPGDQIGCLGDLDYDGVVGGQDLGTFFASWELECPDDPAP